MEPMILRNACRILSPLLLFLFLCVFPSTPHAQQKRIYVSNDDHTDYMWTTDEAGYRQSFIRMIDYYLNQADATASRATEYQGRFNLDGTFWIWEYEKNKSASELNRLMNRIKDGIFSIIRGTVRMCSRRH